MDNSTETEPQPTEHSRLTVVQLQENNCLSDAETEAAAGMFLTEKDFDYLVSSDTDVFKPNGDLLLRYRTNVLPPADCFAAFPALRKAAVKQGNRGLAAGKRELYEENQKKLNIGKETETRYFEQKADGTISNTHRAKPVESGIIGFFDRITRFPYCRQTAFTQYETKRWNNALPFFQAVSAAFELLLPERAEPQREFTNRTAKDFVIENTVFTTITVNRNWQTAIHKDAGDLRQGFGVLTVLRAGLFSGCFFIFPKFKIAVDISNFSILLCDVHEYHGNTNFTFNGRALEPLADKPAKDFERLSMVFYAREQMNKCGTAAEEETRAKSRKRGDSLY